MAQPTPTFVTDDDGNLIASYGKGTFRFHEPLGIDLVKLEKMMQTDNDDVDSQTLAMVLETLGEDGLKAADYLQMPLKLYKALGKEVMGNFRA
jgi:hypothetical protein